MARIVAKLDRNEELALLPLEDEEAGCLLAAVPEELRSESWWLVLRDGTEVAGDKGGIVALFAEVQPTRPLASVVRRVRLSPLLDVLYKLLSRCRTYLSWFVPEGAGPRRYP